MAGGNADDPGQEEVLEEGTLMSHLLELRNRLLRAVIAVGVICLGLLPFASRIFTLVAQPLMKQLPEGSKMIATQVTAPFLTPIKTTFFVALFLAMPVVIYQAWAFVAPGLYRREKRFAMPLLVSSVVLFYVGVCFAYFGVFPLMFAFLTSTTPQGVRMMTDMSSYLDFVLLLLFAFGVAFEVPVAVVLLAATGLVKVDALKKQRGYVLIGIFVIAAILTPPDAVSQCFMAVPMYVLYELGILFAQYLIRQRTEDKAKHEATQQGR